MELFYKLVNYLETYPFSIELIDDCKDIFQYGGWNNEDFERFSKLFYKKVNKSCLSLSKEKTDQILKVIYDRGCLELKDILFIDEAAFTVKNDNFYPKNKKVNFIDFVWYSNKYRWCDFLDTTFFFRHQDLEKMDKSILPKLRKEINEVFVNYFSIMNFPEELGMDSAKGQEYAVCCNKNEIIKGLINKTPFGISIICEVLGKSTVRKLDIICDTNNKRFINVTKVDDNIEKLSEIIDQYRYLNIEEESKCMIKRKK